MKIFFNINKPYQWHEYFKATLNKQMIKTISDIDQ